MNKYYSAFGIQKMFLSEYYSEFSIRYSDMFHERIIFGIWKFFMNEYYSVFSIRKFFMNEYIQYSVFENFSWTNTILYSVFRNSSWTNIFKIWYSVKFTIRCNSDWNKNMKWLWWNWELVRPGNLSIWIIENA